MHYKYENIEHMEGLPLRIFCVSLGERVVHWHKEMEIIFMLRGSVDITLGEEKFSIKEEDVFLINNYDVHGFTNASDDNILLTLQIDMRYARKFYTEIDKVRFNVHYLSNNDSIIHVIRYFLANILVALKSNKESRNLLVMGMVNFLISYLFEDFEHEPNKIMQSKLNNSDRKRIIRVINYVNENYVQKISLQEIAEKEYLSKYYLSHFIKEKLGMSFQELVNEVRLEQAINLLDKTNMKILDISLACGFSDAKYLNKLMKERFGCSAKTYQSKNIQTTKTIRYDLTDENYEHMPFDFIEALKRIEKYSRNMWTHEDIIDLSNLNKVKF